MHHVVTTQRYDAAAWKRVGVNDVGDIFHTIQAGR